MDYKPDFLQIPYMLFEDENLQPADMKVYAIIYYFSKMKGEKCIASNNKIARFAKIAEGTIHKSLGRLEKQQYIIRTYKDAEKRIRDEIIPLIQVTKGVLSGDRGGTVTRQRGVLSGDRQIRKRDKENLLINSYVKKTVSQSASSASTIKKTDYPVSEEEQRKALRSI